jgi:hypothetical protein
MTSPQNLPATLAGDYGTGYEDLDDDITAVPRIGIVHNAGVFKDSLSGEEFAEIVGIPLGVVKQRTMWPAEMGETPSKPLCKSNDAKVGYPNPDAEKDGGFPWSDAPGLDPNTQPTDQYGRKIIDCESCPFAQWGKDAKTGKAIPPPCKERHTYPILYNREGTKFEPPYMESGIVSFQGSGIKPSKMYVSGFKRAGLPLYAGVVRISLERNKRGMVEYSVPKFQKLDNVPDGEMATYAQEWPAMRTFLTDPPRAEDDGSDPARGHGQSSAAAARNAGIVQNSTVTVASTSPNGPATEVVEAEVVPDDPTPAATPVAAPAPTPAPAAQAAPAAPPAPAQPEADDDLPF